MIQTTHLSPSPGLTGSNNTLLDLLKNILWTLVFNLIELFGNTEGIITSYNTLYSHRKDGKSI